MNNLIFIGADYLHKTLYHHFGVASIIRKQIALYVDLVVIWCDLELQYRVKKSWSKQSLRAHQLRLSKFLFHSSLSCPYNPKTLELFHYCLTFPLIFTKPTWLVKW